MVMEYDVTGAVSDGLATVIEAVLDNPGTVKTVTLGVVHNAIEDGAMARLIDLGHLEPDADYTPLREELQELIRQYGVDQPAQSFVRYAASEELAVAIRAALDTRDPELPLTLGALHEACEHGLLAQLAGMGEIEQDDGGTLRAEIGHLIDLHGADAPAEDFLP